MNDTSSKCGLLLLSSVNILETHPDEKGQMWVKCQMLIVFPWKEPGRNYITIVFDNRPVACPFCENIMTIFCMLCSINYLSTFTLHGYELISLDIIILQCNNYVIIIRLNAERFSYLP